MFEPSKCSSHKTTLIYELKQSIIKDKSGEKFQKHIWDFEKKNRADLVMTYLLHERKKIDLKMVK